jgi:hypothetical protein
LCLRPPRPIARSRDSASTEESRSSCIVTGKPKRPWSWRAKRSALRVTSCASPSSVSGSPTTRRVGFHSAMNSATARKRAAAARASMLASGCAMPTSVSPTATPR